MKEFKSNDNHSLLNEEKKSKIMNDLRKEIDKQKEQYSMNSLEFKDMNNYDIQNINNSNNNKFINSQPKFTYECNDEVDDNELENRNSNIINEFDDNEEEHLKILNNAKNVLSQIQDDINKFSNAYGIENISGKNKNISTKNNLIPDHSHFNYDINNNSLNENSNNNDKENDDNYNEIYYNNDNINNENYNDYECDYNNNQEENKYNDQYDDEEEDFIEYKYKDNQEDNIEGTNQNNDDNNVNEINNNYSSNEINDYSEYKKEPSNNSFEEQNSYKHKMENKESYLQDELPRKNELLQNYSIDLNFNNNRDNEINKYSNNDLNNCINKGISKIKYNFENPLNYDKETRKNNFKNYSNYSNYSNTINQKRIESNNDDNINYNKKREAKSTEKYKIKYENNDFNNININENINKSKVNNKKNKNNNDNKKYNNISNDNIFALKNKEKFEIMKKELENKFAKEHPFRPKINKNYNEKNDETEEERLNRLSRPKILDINEKKRKKELEEIKKNSENNKKKGTYKIDPKEVSNRLYNLHQQIKIKKDKIMQNYEEDQNKEYSFTPQINTYSKILMEKYKQKPIYERNEDFEKQKADNIIKMRQEREKEEKERCKPLINEKSRKIALMNRHNNYNEYGENYQEDVYERLYKEKINKDKKSLENREMKECTFSPKLNPMTNYLINNDYYSNNYNDDNFDNEDDMKDFLERQKKYEELKKEKLAKNIINNEAKYSFKPEINSNSDLLVKCNQSRVGENNNDKYSRLYQDAQKIKIKKEKLENELNNKYDFKPKINELSKYIGRKPDIKELYYNQEIKENSKIDKKEEEEYDFKPKIFTNKYKNIQSNYKNDQNMLERINEEVQNKNKKIKMMQKIKENKDIEQCNFAPEINKEIPDFENNKPLYMKGMARYLNQMEKARQAKRDKEQREKEVFLTGEGWNKNNGITVPKPFKLSYQNNKNNEMMKKEREKQDKNECSFKPKTNEGKNREIIKKLLIEN